MNHLTSAISPSTDSIPPRVYSSPLQIGRRFGSDRFIKMPFCFIFATFNSAFESSLLFNVCPGLYCHSQEHGHEKKPLFSCRGCNSMLSEPIVVQELHLFLLWYCLPVLWEQRAPRQAQSRRCTNQGKCISLHTDQRSLEANSKQRLNKHVTPTQLRVWKLYAGAQLHWAWCYTFM